MALLTIVLCSVANMWAGWEKGDRYSGGLLTAVALYISTFNLTASIALGLGFILWRLPGWQKALDMGRNEGSVQRDVAIMFGLACIPALVLTLGSAGYGGLILAPLITLCYYGAMWWVPYTPKYNHIKIAEGTSGAMFGLVGYLVA